MVGFVLLVDRRYLANVSHFLVNVGVIVVVEHLMTGEAGSGAQVFSTIPRILSGPAAFSVFHVFYCAGDHLGSQDGSSMWQFCLKIFANASILRLNMAGLQSLDRICW